MVDLKSPTEDETTDNNNDFLFIKDTDTQKEGETEKKDEKGQEHEKHENLGRTPTEMEHNRRFEKNQKFHGDYKTQNLKRPTGTMKLKHSKQSLKKNFMLRGNMIWPGSINPVCILDFNFI